MEEERNWVPGALSVDDPTRFHKVQDVINYINEIGFLPLFNIGIKGFSLEEHTAAAHWWCDDPKIDPWIWRRLITETGEIAYGKFFDKKAGFISKKWIPTFANYRRDGYDFDALYEDGKAPRKHKIIMDNFVDENANLEIFSNELKQLSGFGKDGEKGYETAITNLMMQFYLCNCHFKKRVNKQGIEYGWEVAIYSTFEHMWGYDYVTSEYKTDPLKSKEKIISRIRECYTVEGKIKI